MVLPGERDGLLRVSCCLFMVYCCLFAGFHCWVRFYLEERDGLLKVYCCLLKVYCCLLTGFHSWVRFYLEERDGNIDYQGFLSYDSVGGRKRRVSIKRERAPASGNKSRLVS